MELIARITFFNDRNIKQLFCFRLEKHHGQYWWLPHSYNTNPTYLLYIKKPFEKIKVGKYVLSALPFEDWHLSKLAIRYNEYNRKSSQ